MKKHLVVNICGHGYGHASQLVPVMERLAKQLDSWHFTLRTSLPERFLRHRFDIPFSYQYAEVDFGMQMKSAISVDREMSIARYWQQHQQWPQRLDAEMQALKRLKTDAVLVNINHLTLAAAKRLEIPGIALACLNWADILQPFLDPHKPSHSDILGQLREAYNDASLFIQSEPSMPMPWLRRSTHVGPLGRIGRRRQDEIKKQLKVAPDQALVALMLGGIETQLPAIDWPSAYFGLSQFDQINLPFIDIICSCDAVITKPGYGTFTELACNAVPALYLPRSDWAESPYLCRWIDALKFAAPITLTTLTDGGLESALRNIIESAPQKAIEPVGVAQAVQLLRSALS